MTVPDEFAERVAAGCMTSADLERQRSGYAAWLNSGGAVSLERCLRLPATAGQRRRQQRNLWLCKAAALVCDQAAGSQSSAIANAYQVFLSRGPWRSWRTMGRPPEGASDLRIALFHIARLHDGRTLSEKQIGNVIRNFSIKKFPQTSFIVEP